jgi:hypothetical protein
MNLKKQEQPSLSKCLIARIKKYQKRAAVNLIDLQKIKNLPFHGNIKRDVLLEYVSF